MNVMINKSYRKQLSKRFPVVGWQLVFLLTIFLAGCGELGETFSELSSLQTEIENQYGDDGDLTVQYTIGTGVGKAVTIEWENSTVFSLDDPDVAEKTKELAEFVYENYEGIDKVENVSIILIKSQHFLVVSSTRTQPFLYAVDELGDSLSKED